MKQLSKFTNGNVPGLSGLSGFKPGDRTLKLQQPYMKGDDVKFVQGVVGVTVDGIFGPQTSAGVKNFQANNGLMSTGYVGDLTWEKLKDTGSYTPPKSLLPDSFTQTLDNLFESAKGSTDWLTNPDKSVGGNSGNQNQSSTKSTPWGWYLGGGAVAVSLLGVIIASSGDNK